MKKLLLSLLAFAVFAWANVASAQIKTPAASPACKVVQTAGLTDITIEYSRPSVKGRTIFGGLVPFGELWRTGANANTKITFSDKVTIDGKELKAGTYALYTIPNPESWDVIFYTDTENWGTPREYDEAKEALRVTVPAHTLSDSKLESFSIWIDNLRDNSCDLIIGWDQTLVSIPITLNTDATVEADIKRVMGGPTANDYYAAGRYYMDSGKDLNQAYEWLHKANEMNPRFWTLRQEAICLSKMGKYAEAIKVAERSLAEAVKAGNKDYERMNKESIAEWQSKL
ncbi:MAG: DUF2911 domain-containing protein [Bacteroidetes bacterium]|nr:MAG: DUF2911 domain-containing protein [Bacteroidota bacterium]